MRTYCRICESLCGLEAEVGDGGALRLRPDREHPVSGGFVCAKGTRFAELASHPERLLEPQRRNSRGELESASWDAVYAEIGERIGGIIEEHGPHAVGVYVGNPLAFNAFGTMGLVPFLRALGTRNIYGAGSQDCNNKFTGSGIVHGSPVVHPIPDFERAELAVVFGSNPAVSQSSFVHLAGGSSIFDRMVERGARVIWVDPRRSESASRWGEHVAIRPGTDIVLLLALLRAHRDRYRPEDSNVSGLETLLELAEPFTFERAAQLTGLEVEVVASLAESIRSTERVALHMSVGVNQGRFGTLAYVTLQALMYLTGSMDVEGGSLFHPLAAPAAEVGRWFGVEKPSAHSRVGHFPATLYQLPGGVLADEMLTPGDGQIRALIVIAGDPLQSIPGAERLEKGLEGLEALVCVDLFENATGRHADWILPTTSWLERYDFAATSLVLQTEPVLQTAAPVQRAPGETRHELRIMAELSLALSRPFLGSRALTRAALGVPWGRLLGLGGRIARRLLGKRAAVGIPVPVPRPGTYLGRGPRTLGHTMRFWDGVLDGEVGRLRRFIEEEERAEHGFRLVGRRRRLGHNSWLHKERHDGEPKYEAWLHAEDLDALGLAEGDVVSLRVNGVAVTLPARVREGVPKGTVVVPHGLPELNINALLPSALERIEPLSGTLWMTAVPVDVERVGVALQEAS